MLLVACGDDALILEQHLLRHGSGEGVRIAAGVQIQVEIAEVGEGVGNVDGGKHGVAGAVVFEIGDDADHFKRRIGDGLSGLLLVLLQRGFRF